MFKKIVASLAVVLLTVGMSVVGIAAPAGAAPPGGGTYPPTDAAANDPGNWEVLPGEACYKIEPVNPVPYLLPSPGAGQQFSKVIVKAGSGDGSNLVLTDGLAEGTPVQHNLKDSISHLILCTVPTPVDPILTDASVTVTTTPATCEAAEGDLMVAAVNATFVTSYPTETTYRVVATADDNHLFSNGEPTLVIEDEFAPKLAEGCELPPLALVTPTYSSTQPTCTTAGSYTLGSDGGDVVWTVDGETGVASGTYSAPSDYSDVTISATPAVAGDGLDPDWVNPKVLTFTAPTGCGETPPTSGAASASVTTTPATCEAAEGDVVVTVTNATFALTYPTETTYRVVATADDNHLFSNGEPTLVIEDEFAPKLAEGCELPPLALVTPTYSSTQPTCTTAGSYTLGSDGGDVVWTVDGETGVASGTYSAPSDYSDVTISATPAVAGDGLDPDWVNPKVLTFTAPTGCGETPPTSGAASASVTTTPATCEAAEGDVVVTVTNATFALTYPTETTYRVVATADDNHLFSNGEPTLVIEDEFAPKLVEGCELPSFALVTPTYSSTQPTCTAGGSYTLGSIVGELVWTVNGETGVASGTYSAPSDYSDVTITAAPAVAGDGLDPDWVNPIVLRFAAPAGVCSFNPPTLAFNPPTLAFTGLTIGAGMSLAGGLLFVGLAGLFVARHRRLHG
ncbi:hypothetical protein SAMN06296378_2554 [Salinibacterium xinjiangense]|uniref:Ig-like domain-containing protein n=1 Tax=Salinibacterium xinjiangense TaxID=386302 RepID=A0A2C9A189_9MICO|nr:hypothetical protein [Salinibacterium xinjiangense]SOE72601.1 hypothetical protein SAMN06296378_2554 [Salinibacterium xinjiangense]